MKTQVTPYKHSPTAKTARQLRIAVTTNVFMQGFITESEAKKLLNLPLDPDKPETLVDDSWLLGDPDAIAKIKNEVEE